MRHALHSVLLLNLLVTACGPSQRETPPSFQPTPTTQDTAIPHSTLSDTTGMANDLRIIERKLGPLDAGISQHLQAVEVQYYGFTDTSWTTVDTTRLCSGVLLVHTCVADDVRAIFAGLRTQHFPIAKVVPINRYGLNADSTGWNDEASMADNNTSAFNYRGKAHVPETSKHAQGIAIDINPVLNPLVRGNLVQPRGAQYDPDRPGTLTRAGMDHLLRPLGWSWGGRWRRPQDHQHIEKVRGHCPQLTFTAE